MCNSSSGYYQHSTILEMKPLNNVILIEVKDGRTTILYKDGTRLTTKENITLSMDYKNENDQPIIDHCI